MELVCRPGELLEVPVLSIACGADVVDPELMQASLTEWRASFLVRMLLTRIYRQIMSFSANALAQPTVVRSTRPDAELLTIYPKIPTLSLFSHR